MTDTRTTSGGSGGDRQQSSGGSTAAERSTGQDAGQGGAQQGGAVEQSGPPQPAVPTIESERGVTTISENVVTTIAAIAAQEIEGVVSLGGAVQNAFGGVLSRLTGAPQQGGGGSQPSTGGVNVEVGRTQAAVDLTMRMLYPASIHEVAERVRRNVIQRIERMTGLEVVEVNVAVTDLVFPDDQQSDQGY